MSETRGNEEIGEPDERDAQSEDPSTTGKPEITAGEEGESGAAIGRLEEREQRQQGVQQHGDTFAVDTEAPTDTSGIRHGTPNRVTAPPEDEDDDAGDPLAPLGQ